ncbi:MAG: DUF523 and DUF1722 domain-containing protein [Ghiorsea sp.]
MSQNKVQKKSPYQTQSVKPRIVVSRCLGFEACRYNAQLSKNDFVALIQPFVEFITVCPEADIGLGTPRKPVRLVLSDAGEKRLVQPATGADVTDLMQNYIESTLASFQDIDGFLLKARSPSCGPTRVKIYADNEKGSASEPGAGMYAEAIAENLPHAALEDEGRMFDFHLRESFLMRIFSLARLRALEANPSIKAISTFHAQHKLLLMCYHQDAMRECGRIASNPPGQSLEEIMHAYANAFRQALNQLPSKKNIINALYHGYGWISDGLADGEKTLFLESIEEYRDDRVTLATLQLLLKSFVVRLNHEYLGSQVFLAPYPQALCKT